MRLTRFFAAFLFTTCGFTMPVTAGGNYTVSSPPCLVGGSTATGAVRVPPCIMPCCEDPTCYLIIVSLRSSSRLALQVESPVLVERVAGAFGTGTFLIETGAVTSRRDVTITATFQTSDEFGEFHVVGTDTTTLTLLPAAEILDSFTLNPGIVLGGSLSQGTLQLECEAPPGGWPVQVSSDHAAAQPVEPQVTVPAGATSTTFLVRTTPVLEETFVTITAASGGTALQQSLRILPGTLDLSIRKIEMTQGIQYLDDPFGIPDNSIYLVRGKPTVVRVYLTSNTPFTIPLVPVSLASRPWNGPKDVWTFHSPLWPFATVQSTATPLEQRESPASAAEIAAGPLNASFLLDPAVYDQGDTGGPDGESFLIFRTEVNPDRLIVEENYANNVHSSEHGGVAYFYRTSNLNIKFVRIDWCPGCPFDTNPRHKPEWTVLNHLLPVVEKMFPVDRVNYWHAQREVNIMAWTPSNFERDAAWGYVLGALATMKAFTDDEAPNMHYYGLLDDAVPASLCGMAWLPPNPRVGLSDVGCGGATVAHELAHNLGRLHAPCPAPGNPGAPDDPDPNWPQTTNPNARIGHTGFDVDSRLALKGSPTSTGLVYFDLMSYCKPRRWPSTYTYQALSDAYQSQSTSAADEPIVVGGLQDHLVVRGVIDEDGELFVPPVYRKDFPSGVYDYEGIGSHAMVLHAADGKALRARRFTPEMEDAPQGRAFFEIVPFEPDMTEVRFMAPGPSGEEVVQTTPLSAANPMVTLIQPNGGEGLSASGSFLVTWNSTDADGDALYHLVLYSPDGGATWQALAIDVLGQSFAIDLSDLPGTDQGLIRVIASDGLRTSQDTSDATFSVDGKAPEVLILAPADRAVFTEGAAVSLRGTATDTEDGPITDDGLTWASGRDGNLGMGSEVAALPSTGVHAVTFQATDTDGNSSTRQISFAVGLVGDCTNDGVVRLEDFTIVQACLNGPGSALLPKQCACADLDADGDVDLFDLAYFPTGFSAPLD